MRLIVLGTGANGGIPELGCKCRVCSATKIDPAESRMRSSIALALDSGKFLLFDATPDIRVQLSLQEIYGGDIGAIFLTHAHYDHIGGLMEFLMTRSFMVDVFAHPVVINRIVEQHKLDGQNVFQKFLNFRSEYQHLRFEGIKVTGFRVRHTINIFGPTLGYEIETDKHRFAYVPDIACLDNATVDRLKLCDFAILDGTFSDHSLYGHVSMKETIRTLELEKRPSRIFFTHINHTEGLHNEIEHKFPKGERYFLLRDGENMSLKALVNYHGETC